MNRYKILVPLFLTSLACATTGNSKPACAGTCDRITGSSDPIVLSDLERSALVFQIEEERMARELYVRLGEKWNLRPFQQIAKSEAKHESALQALAVRSGIDVPAAVPGMFASGEIQARYDALLKLGLESEVDALRAGAQVEEQDIADLRTLAAETDNVTIQQTITALERASGHHLSAFVRNLSVRGVEYSPKVVVNDDDSPGRKGRQGQGCVNECGPRGNRGRV